MQAEERVAFASRRGNRLVGVVHTAAGEGAAGSPAGVILCHGMESTKDGAKQRLLGERLSRAGMSVLRFDFSYVGESEGEFADLTFRGEVDDLVGAWDFFRTRVGGPIGLLGSSMGGAVALLFAAAEPRVRALATIAAVAHPARVAGRASSGRARALADGRNLVARRRALEAIVSRRRRNARRDRRVPEDRLPDVSRSRRRGSRRAVLRRRGNRRRARRRASP